MAAWMLVSCGLLSFLGDKMGVISDFFGAGTRPPVKRQPPIVRQPVTVQRTASTTSASPAASHAIPVKAAPAAGDKEEVRGQRSEVGAAAVPYRHGAGLWVPPGTANGPIEAGQGASVEVPVKAHVRTIPAKPVEEKSLLPAAITDDVLVGEFLRGERITVQRALLRGCLCEEWIRIQLEQRTALDRATAIKKIESLLAAAKAEKKESRPRVCIRVYWVARLFSGWSPEVEKSRAAASSLSFTAVRLFHVFLENDGAEDRRRLIPQYAAAARDLWERAVAGRMSAAACDAEITKILPARSLPIKKHRPVKLSLLLKMAPRLPIADVPTLIARLQEIQRQSLLSESKAG